MNINIQNNGSSAVIDIDGVIGVPEWLQFDDPAERVTTYEHFSAKLAEIAALSATKIDVNIRSTGGNMDDALKIYDALITNSAIVSTHCFGYVASAATIIAQAANKGRRYISDNALYLIHQASTEVNGNTADLDDARQMLEATNERMANIYSKSGSKGLTADDYLKLMAESNGKGIWLSADKVLEYGLADKKEAGTITNVVDTKVFAEAGLPIPHIVESKSNEMEEKKTFVQRVLGYLGFAISANEVAEPMTPEDMGEALDALEAAKAEVDNLKNENEAQRATIEANAETHAKEVADLRAQLDALTVTNKAQEDELILLRTQKTNDGRQVQDPTEGELSGNAKAYANDVAAFK